MADLKISQLSDGGNAQAADEFVVARSGANYRIDGASVAAAATSVGTLSSLTVSGGATFASTTGNVGIGTTTPVDTDGFGKALDIRSTAGGQVVIRDSDDTTKFARLAYDGGSTNVAYVGAVGSGTQLLFTAGGATVGRFDASGNLGLGVTPSAWSGYRALDIGNDGIASYTVSNDAGIAVSSNCYFNGSNWVYKTNNEASYYAQYNGIHSWYNAASGTGNITFGSAKMTLDASGRLQVGTTTQNGMLTVNANATTTYGTFNAPTSGYAYHNYQYNGSNIAIIGQGNGLFGGGTTSEFGITTASGAALLFGTNSTERARITSGGQLAMNSDGSAAAPIITRVGDEDTGIFYPAANKIALATSGAEQFRVGANGTTYSATTTGIARSTKQSLGAVSSFTIDLAALMADMPISGNFRYGKIWVYYFISARATIEEYMFAATNAAGTIELVKRVSQGTAITGTATISSGNTTLTVDITPSATLAAGAYYAEMTVV